MAGYLLLRSLLAPIVQAVVAVLTAAQPPRQEAAQAPLSHSGELKKDPVCGTVLASELAVQGRFKGEIVHFCSAKCRDEYARRA